LTKGRRIVTSDVGQHQMWVAQYYNSTAAALDQSGGLGTMGFGLPAAMGVQMVNPDATVVCVTGESVDPDVHPGAVDLQAVPPADQGREPQTTLHGHGAAMAGIFLWQPLRRVVHGSLRIS